MAYSLGSEYPIELEPSDIVRYWAKVEKTPTCWLWTAALVDGYGVFSMKRLHRNFRAHRVSWTLLRGPIPSDMTLDHDKTVCPNRHCVNPDHLRLMTRGENAMAGNGPAALAARKTHCPAGHEYSGDNLRVNADGSRHCRTCERERKRELRKR